jgi:hypothetical protein
MLLDFLVCDDVRQERGDKLTLVGVYSDAIKLSPPPPSWPVILPKIGFFMRVALAPFVPERYSFKILHNWAVVAEVGDRVTVADPAKPITLVVVGSPFPVPGPGQLTFELSFSGGEDRREVRIERSVEISTT